MAGELSPDRLFYWDGAQWVSAFSADGAWQWDGAAWRPAARQAGRRPASRWLWLIAVGVVATLVVVSAGTYFAWRLFNRTVQTVLAPACSSPLAQAGHGLTSGESLCGKKLGDERLLADCTLTDGVPAGVDLWQKSYRPSEGDWVKVTASTSASGCNLEASPYTYLALEASDTEPASAVLVVDFSMSAWTGWVGLRLACSDDAGCIDLGFSSEGRYRLDEAGPKEKNWENLTAGAEMSLSPPHVGANRMILRLVGRQADVFIDGVALTHATTKRAMSDGYAGFYLDNQAGSSAVSVLVERMYVFDAV